MEKLADSWRGQDETIWNHFCELNSILWDIITCMCCYIKYSILPLLMVNALKPRPLQEFRLYLIYMNYTIMLFNSHFGIRLKYKNYCQASQLGICLGIRHFWKPCKASTGLEITAGQRTMSGLIVDLTGQTLVLPVMLTGQNSVVLKMK